MELQCIVVNRGIPSSKHRWFGVLSLSCDDRELTLYLSGTVAQWIFPGEKVILEADSIPEDGIFKFTGYRLWRLFGKDCILVWPVWRKETEKTAINPVTGEELYTYHILAREAMFESDFEAIAELEQYHYASEKELVALWRCEKCGELIEANTRPKCPSCGSDDVHIVEIKGSTPASRFMIMELTQRKPYEPRVVGYVRIDPPIPKMNRIHEDGSVTRNIREKVFPREWFFPPFWPEGILRKMEKTSATKSRYKLWQEAKEEAMRRANTAGARIARVVIHPDYRSDGLGQLAVQLALEWIKKRRIPEMRRRKHVVETIAQMARFNPFFERVGFRFLWITNNRPVLFYPLTKEAEEYINQFLSEDPEAKKHGGKLCVSRYGKVEMLNSPIVFNNVTKIYESELDLKGVSDEIRFVLEAFGVKERKLQRTVLRNVNFSINPGEMIVIIGASGAGKTTLLNMLIGKVLNDQKMMPTDGKLDIPKNVHMAALIPGEFEPKFGEKCLLEYMVERCGDIYLATEILNRSGLSDAVLYRARYHELSTGQKERARIAAVLAERPNLLLIDEFAAHLDAMTATRVARQLNEIARSSGITILLVTHRPEIIKALGPDKLLYVGYGTVIEEKKA